MGDPAGVGPEICLRLLLNQQLTAAARILIFGDAKILALASEKLGVVFKTPVVSLSAWNAKKYPATGPTVIDFGNVELQSFEPGKLSPICGEAAYQYLEVAIDNALSKTIDAIVTAPLNKEALHLAGHKYPGHTEILAERTETDDWCMMLTSPEITCSFVTAHVGYREVPELLSVEKIVRVIRLTRDAMRKLRHREPELVVCGLNPHAGEHGLFGNREEERIIEPACELARKEGARIVGPLPPDTCFLKSRREKTDAFICMYHDQGHIPLKALAFESAINTTLGLPIVRTSVDHGTAFDIAWQGIADPSSLYAAVEAAIKFSQR